MYECKRHDNYYCIIYIITTNNTGFRGCLIIFHEKQFITKFSFVWSWPITLLITQFTVPADVSMKFSL